MSAQTRFVDRLRSEIVWQCSTRDPMARRPVCGAIRELTRSFDLPTEFGITLPDAVAANSLVRRKLVDVDDGDVRRRVDFDRPYEREVRPPEYATINCAGFGCTFNGISSGANG